MTETTESLATRNKTPTGTEPQSVPQCTGSWNPDLIWDFPGQNDVNSVIAGEETTFALLEDSIVALDTAKGEVKWKRSVDGLDGIGLKASSFRTDTRVIVCGSRKIAAIEPSSGAIQWSFTIPGKERTAGIQAATVYDDELFIGAVKGDTPSFEALNPYTRIYSLNTKTGEHRTFVKLSSKSNPPNLRSLIADGNSVYVNTGDGLTSFDLNGQMEWDVDVSPASTPALQDNTIIIPTKSSLVALETATGKETWTNRTAYRTVAIKNGIAYAPVRFDNEMGIAAISVQDGTVVWETNTVGKGGRPVVHDSVVYFPVSREGQFDQLMAFDSRSGCEIGSLSFESDPLYMFDVGDKHIFAVVGVTDGELQLYDKPELKS